MRITDFEMIHEIKEEYISLRRLQNNRATAVEKLIAEYRDELTIGYGTRGPGQGWGQGDGSLVP